MIDSFDQAKLGDGLGSEGQFKGELLIGAVVISFSPVFVKVADVEPTAAGFYRCGIGGLFLLGIVIVRRQSLWAGAVPLALAFAATGLKGGF